MIFKYVLFFLLFGILGTLIESLGSSLKKHRLVYSPDRYQSWLPIRPIYGFGGVLVYEVLKILNTRSWLEAILWATLAASIWEYFCGWFCVVVLKKRLWSYQKHMINLSGHVSLLSTFWWFSLILIFYLSIYKQLLFWETSFLSR